MTFGRLPPRASEGNTRTLRFVICRVTDKTRYPKCSFVILLIRATASLQARHRERSKGVIYRPWASLSPFSRFPRAIRQLLLMAVAGYLRQRTSSDCDGDPSKETVRPSLALEIIMSRGGPVDHPRHTPRSAPARFAIRAEFSTGDAELLTRASLG